MNSAIKQNEVMAVYLVINNLSTLIPLISSP